ncbi:hypothetical protein OIU85_027753 [Salix viminalis]|uniref:Glabrous enhancer-binding protein-like DBD domain-containing protein n=1 Tax=Salix viminalis TaxID=40686 RepID=A0A9Q0QIQ9_SALVM|nr:hypothetical protein OIU85_027753 [Salix viminalis]
MDSTPVPQHLPFKPSSSSSSASKLPIKRKTPDSLHHHHLLSPKLENYSTTTNPDAFSTLDTNFESKPPPFKFHRIWSEPDEINFLQGLLSSSSQGLSFPKDLPFFYDRFSNSVSQPYTKSQLSEKLRRLRKKFRSTSSRLARNGFNYSLLSPHDRALFHLSKQLWSPEFDPSSPIGGNKSTGGNSNSNFDGNMSSARCDNDKRTKLDEGLVCDKGSILPIFGSPCANVNVSNELNDLESLDLDEFDDGYIVKMREGNVGWEVDKGVSGCGSVAVKSVAKNVLNVFDECLNEVKKVVLKERLDSSMEGKKEKDFQRRWREQRVAEFDVLALRLRLLLDNSAK